MSSLKTNVVLNFLNTVTGIIFPVITFPYAARVLLPEGIGAVNFLQAIQEGESKEVLRCLYCLVDQLRHTDVRGSGSG